MTRTARQGLGDAGERHVRRHLESAGYLCLAEQWRCPEGELDLVMRQHNILVFVEVKTRRGGLLAPEATVSPAQQRRLLAAAQRFLENHPELQDLVWRVDVVGLALDRAGRVSHLVHLENAILG